MTFTVEWIESGDEDCFNGKPQERRREVQAEVECPRCAKTVELVAETDGHTLLEDGRWHHESYGPATGDCCGLLFADWFEGTHVYDLDEEQRKAESEWAAEEIDAGRCPAGPDSMHGPLDGDGRCMGCHALVGEPRERDEDLDDYDREDV